MKLIKRILPVWFILAGFSVSFASSPLSLADKPFGFGAKAGLINSRFVPDDGSAHFSKWQSGMQVGGYFRFNINEYLMAGTELLYSQYGTYDLLDTALFFRTNLLLSNLPPTEKNKRFDVRMETIDIPVMIIGKYAIFPDLKACVYIGANLTIDVISRMRITREIDISGQKGERSFYVNVSDRIKKYEYSPIMGLGLTSEMLGLKFGFDLRYKYGMININKVENLTGFTNRAVIIAFSVGL